MGVNPGYQLVNNKEVPQIADDYMHTFKLMRGLPCDIPLGSHPAMYNMAEKYAKIGKSATNPFIDPEGYQKEIDINEQAFTLRRGAIEGGAVGSRDIIPGPGAHPHVGESLQAHQE